MEKKEFYVKKKMSHTNTSMPNSQTATRFDEAVHSLLNWARYH